ncbi:type II toxin-antitoxin system HicB family antitoxin [Methylobacterium sp. R2-1]|uniref:type II toxin-antitoxin system HicB family antitoxin n=1 Tax=Methylobacterium sp. R2-1 TaxID=2587064 RepID=UPI00160AA541|nr:type II toxin-antitoxin system HicB family antitoxin [Methylobacterium sp. R2-1]
MGSYFTILHLPESDSSWGVTFPDLPSCVSAGDSFEDAALAAREALPGHLAALRADGDPVPLPAPGRNLGRSRGHTERLACTTHHPQTRPGRATAHQHHDRQGTAARRR